MDFFEKVIKGCKDGTTHGTEDRWRKEILRKK